MIVSGISRHGFVACTGREIMSFYSCYINGMIFVLKHCKLRALIGLMAVGSLALSGCTSNSPSEDITSTTKPIAEALATVPSEQSGTPQISSESLDLIADKDLTDVICTQDKSHSWSFSGTLNNSTDKAQTYTVAVAVTEGASVKGHTLLTKNVPAHNVVRVLSKNFAESSAGICVPVTSVER